MNKVLSISAIMAVLSLPAMAEITTGSTCDTTNLGQSENNSTANVEADWTANTINIDWWTGDEDSDDAYASTTCTYDGTITLPTQPTKTGYTFAGWRLAQVAESEIRGGCSNAMSAEECSMLGSPCGWNQSTNACIDESTIRDTGM